ncbi:zinc dependent phospholipase C family protein [uncultured Pseudodesulfovibrio sp.]|uniref:zinc dependent phospholipase C family protein n=1 Tax=uncultured Pseudodesulfovibrio sp. TaxID=2035858 RepID=UPI0029C89C21|nr:zinc dependent phospholipase C family protein [uncultured Pseudodesulfovibrio sp.]
MPKELTHFKIAERTATRLGDTRFSAALSRCPQGLLLGSILPDVAFYGVLPTCRPIRSLGNTIHGSGNNDTFALVRVQARHAQAMTDKELPSALLVGLISHILADAVFHPMVWYFTGDYHASDKTRASKAQQRHRALESLMDMVLCPEMIGRKQYSMREHLRQCPDLFATGLPTRELATMADSSPQQMTSALNTAWRTFATMQQASAIRPLSAALFALFPILPGSIREIATLFYAPQLMRQSSMVTGHISFLHPKTGKKICMTAEEMMNEAADRAAALCRRIEPAVFDNEPIALPETGPSMDADFSGNPAPPNAYFADPPLPLLE